MKRPTMTLQQARTAKRKARANSPPLQTMAQPTGAAQVIQEIKALGEMAAPVEQEIKPKKSRKKAKNTLFFLGSGTTQCRKL